MTKKDNTTPYQSDLYDAHVVDTIPYYHSFHLETINLLESFSFEPKTWMDTGCGTGSLVKMALEHFPNTKFFLLDPSESMLNQAKEKLSFYSGERLKFLEPSPTQKLSLNLEEKLDVITAIQCHHYLSQEDRNKATKVCYELLRERGVFITFENIRPLTDKGIEIGKNYWKNFQLSKGKNPEEVENHIQRFDVEYFPINIEEHLKLLGKTGFRIVELFWYSYMQAGFYGIK